MRLDLHHIKVVLDMVVEALDQELVEQGKLVLSTTMVLEHHLRFSRLSSEKKPVFMKQEGPHTLYQWLHG